MHTGRTLVILIFAKMTRTEAPLSLVGIETNRFKTSDAVRQSGPKADVGVAIGRSIIEVQVDARTGVRPIAPVAAALSRTSTSVPLQIQPVP